MSRILIFLILFNIGCNTADKETASVEKLKTDTITDDTYIATTPLTQCYGWDSGKDTIRLKLTYENTKVIGDLIYNWAEKDGNKGTLIGEQKDSLLIFLYTFQSEGITSVREAAFKVSGEALIEGYGEIKMEGNVQKFVNRDKLTFDPNRPLKRMDCF